MNRCFTCQKKVGLTGFDCKCKHQFCGEHRLPEAHACPELNNIIQASLMHLETILKIRS